MQANLLPCASLHGLVLSPIALLPFLLLVWLPSYPLASANTTCCQVLAINGLLYRSLYHLSALPRHMLGCGDLDLFFGSPRSPLGDPPPFEASFPQMALVGVGWSSDALLGDATHGCRLLAPTQCLSASWLQSVGSHSIPYNCMWFEALWSMSLVVAQVRKLCLQSLRFALVAESCCVCCNSVKCCNPPHSYLSCTSLNLLYWDWHHALPPFGLIGICGMKI
jgi:hypothetical protein